MSKNSLALVLLAGACCLVFSQKAKADVNSITDVSYYEPTNSIFAWAEVIPDYDTLAYYCFDDWGYVRKDDEVIHSFWGGSCDGQSYSEGFFPYDPNADYTIEVYPQLIAKHNYLIGDGYQDYYNYIQWSYGDPLYFPYYFGFTGPGPEMQINPANILLGAVYSIFTEGARAGQPHHVKVVSDNGESQLACGTIQRRITFQVVDSAGRRTGNTSTRERFYNPSSGLEIGAVYNSCRNESIQPSACSIDIGGRFTDQLWVGCPTVSGFCAMDQIISKWVWCPRAQPERVLTSNTYHVRNTFVHVNGGSQFAPNTHLYP